MNDMYYDPRENAMETMNYYLGFIKKMDAQNIEERDLEPYFEDSTAKKSIMIRFYRC
jgi:hypothetical protein